MVLLTGLLFRFGVSVQTNSLIKNIGSRCCSLDFDRYFVKFSVKIPKYSEYHSVESASLLLLYIKNKYVKSYPKMNIGDGNINIH